MKRVLFLNAGSEFYGADKVLFDLINGLNKELVKPFVILPSEGILADKLRQIGVFVEIIDYPVLRRKFFTPFGIIKYFCNRKKSVNKLIDFCKKYEIDVIHNNTVAVLEGALIKKRLPNIKLVYHVHEILLSPKIVYNYTTNLVFKYADIIIGPSCAVCDNLNRYNHKNNKVAKVIYNGVNLQEYYYNENYKNELRDEYNIPSDAIIIGMIGRVNAWKGQNDFIKCFDKLSQNKKIYAFLIGGTFEGQEWRMDELKEKIALLECKDRVFIEDFRMDAKKFYSLFDVFVLPSNNPDPLPTVVLEAMASECSVVGYSHGGVVEMVEHNKNGLLCKVNEVDDLSEKINTLVSNKNMNEMFRKHSRIIVESRFNLDLYVSNFEKIYLEE